QADEGLTTADEAGYVVLRQPPASKLANLCRIDTSKEPSADLTRFLKTNFFASTVCETSSRQVRWYNVHHAYTGDPRRTKIHWPLFACDWPLRLYSPLATRHFSLSWRE